MANWVVSLWQCTGWLRVHPPLRVCHPTCVRVRAHGTHGAACRYHQVSSGAAAVLRRLVDRLDALLQVQGYCKGDTCRNPWSLLHPAGDVTTLEDAMNSLFDPLYSGYRKYAWKQCARYYDPVRLELKDERLVS